MHSTRFLARVDADDARPRRRPPRRARGAGGPVQRPPAFTLRRNNTNAFHDPSAHARDPRGTHATPASPDCTVTWKTEAYPCARRAQHTSRLNARAPSRVHDSHTDSHTFSFSGSQCSARTYSELVYWRRRSNWHAVSRDLTRCSHSCHRPCCPYRTNLSWFASPPRTW